MPLTSLWQDHAGRTRPTGVPDVSGRYDVAVVGAGLTGLTTALLLGRAGRSVVVLEASWVGAGTTGRSTAKISALQGTHLSKVAAKHSSAVLGQYAEAQLEGVAWLERFGQEHGVAMQHRDAITYATTASGERSASDELEAARAAGLAVDWVHELPLPFPTRGGVRLAGQLQVDPVELLLTLRREAEAHGVEVVEGARVTTVRGSGPVTVATEHGAVRADRVVVATNMPILDRGGFFARMKPARSYIVAFRTPRAAVDAMYLSADQPSRSLRGAEVDGDQVLLVGGAGHTTGRVRSEAERITELRTWTAQLFPDAVESHAWSAQDYVPHHALPYVGPALPGTSAVLVAGGYSKWGMTNAVAAALALSAEILGSRPRWAAAFRTWGPGDLAGLPALLRDNAEVGLELARGWGAAALRRSVHEQGVSRVCTHLGAVVEWNDAESSWDCPLHGSRFDTDGSVLDGPAVCGLRRTVRT